MQMSTALRNLDDKVLGRLGRGGHDGHSTTDGSRAVDDTSGTRADTRPDDGVYPDEPHHARGSGSPEQSPRRPTGDVVRHVLGVVWQVARYVFLALALVVFLGIVLTFAPTNEDNALVSTVLSWAETAAGPFRDVFTADEPRRELLYNYGLATAVYLLAASLVTKLPGRRGATA
jgi:hypothetical protein